MYLFIDLIDNNSFRLRGEMYKFPAIIDFKLLLNFFLAEHLIKVKFLF